MKKLNLFLLFVLTAVVMTSSCLKDTSEVVTKLFQLEFFKGIELSIAGDVIITDGSTQKVEVTGPEKTVNEISKRVWSGIWDINLPNDYRKSYDILDILITSDEIEEIKLSGSGDITGMDTLPLSGITLSGSGNISAITAFSHLISTISGSGNITVSGKTDMLQHTISGSGDFKGFELETSDAVINITGSGNTEVFVTNNMVVNISGSGNVYYKGTPTININITGSGKVIEVN